MYCDVLLAITIRFTRPFDLKNLGDGQRIVFVGLAMCLLHILFKKCKLARIPFQRSELCNRAYSNEQEWDTNKEAHNVSRQSSEVTSTPTAMNDTPRHITLTNTWRAIYRQYLCVKAVVESIDRVDMIRACLVRGVLDQSSSKLHLKQRFDKFDLFSKHLERCNGRGCSHAK